MTLNNQKWFRNIWHRFGVTLLKLNIRPTVLQMFSVKAEACVEQESTENRQKVMIIPFKLFFKQ